MPPQRSAILDMTRGLAILMVVAFHYFPSKITNIGWTGVNLFFVLSGYLIGGLLIDNRKSDTYYATFYARRVARIVPLYAINVLLFAVVAGLDQPLWHYALFVQNFAWIANGTGTLSWMSPTWSLAVEEQFYLILPLLIRAAPLRCIPYVAASLIVAAPTYRLFLLEVVGSDWRAANQALPGCLDSLFLGVLAAWALRQPGLLAALRKRRHWLRLLAGVGLLGVIAVFYSPPDPSSWVSSAAISWIALAYTLGFVSVLVESGGAVKGRGPLCALGVGAYSIYLFHMPIAFAVEGLSGSALIDNIVALIILALVATVCWFVIERPVIAYARRRWSYQRDGQATSEMVGFATAP